MIMYLFLQKINFIKGLIRKKTYKRGKKVAERMQDGLSRSWADFQLAPLHSSNIYLNY